MATTTATITLASSDLTSSALSLSKTMTLTQAGNDTGILQTSGLVRTRLAAANQVDLIASGAGQNYGSAQGGSGGSGAVVIRTPSAFSLAVTPGTNATATHPGGEKIATFTVSGTLTIT